MCEGARASKTEDADFWSIAECVKCIIPFSISTVSFHLLGYITFLLISSVYCFVSSKKFLNK